MIVRGWKPVVAAWAMAAAIGFAATPLSAQTDEQAMAQMAADIEAVMAVGGDALAMQVSQCAAQQLRGLPITDEARGHAEAAYEQLQRALDQCGLAYTASSIMMRLREASPDARYDDLERQMTLAMAPATIALLMLTHQLFGIPFDQPAPLHGELPVRIPRPAE